MKMRSIRGEVVAGTILVYALVAVGLAVVGVKLSGIDLFHKSPPTKELHEAQEKLVAAQKAASDAEAKLQWALLEQRDQTKQQVGAGQEYVEGARSSLKRAPKSPEVTLASGLLDRASLSLSRAIGDLPADRQAEILDIVEKALSEKQEEINQAYVLLAAKDDENEVLQAEKLEVEAKIPELQKKAEVANEKLVATEGVVKARVSEVAAYAEKADLKERENGSLSHFVNSLVKALIVLGIVAAIGYGLWFWRKLRSVSVKTVGTIIGDIRSGVAPTVAFDTNIDKSLHPAVKKQSIETVAANTPTQ